MLAATVPFLAERIARLEARPEFRASVPNGVMFELKRLFFDTALSANRFAFSALLKLVAPEQVFVRQVTIRSRLNPR